MIRTTDLSGWGSTPLSHVCTSDGANCANAKPCDLGLDTQCDGLEVCIGELVVADLL